MILFATVLLSANCPLLQDAALPPDVVVAHVSGSKRGEGVAELNQRLGQVAPGYSVVVHDASSPLPPGAQGVTFLQGEGEFVGEGSQPLSLRIGDMVIHRSDGPSSIRTGDELVSFVLPTDVMIDPDIPTLIRPDFDPRLTDRPGGCATDPGAYRRLLLTWNPERGPYVLHGFNCHRVRIDDSFSHYHPVEGGFDEFYLVQEAPAGARLIVSRRTSELLAGAVEAGDVDELIRSIPLEAGQLILIPRGVTHRGLGGAVIQVLAIPGFLPGQEIPMDEAIRKVNGRFALIGDRALPVHDPAPKD